MDSDTIPKVRILVVGDSGVGKTSLVHNICDDSIQTTTTWTCGANVGVKLFYSNLRHCHYFLEFVDIGGAWKYYNTRHIFFKNINGILFVFDVTNRNSYKKLASWILDITKADKISPVGDRESTGYNNQTAPHPISLNSSKSKSPHNNYSSLTLNLPLSNFSPTTRLRTKKINAAAKYISFIPLESIPIVAIGNKCDLLLSEELQQRNYNTVSDYGLECINLSSIAQAQGQQGQNQKNNSYDELNSFFQKVIDRRFFPSGFDS